MFAAMTLFLENTILLDTTNISQCHSCIDLIDVCMNKHLQRTPRHSGSTVLNELGSGYYVS